MIDLTLTGRLDLSPAFAAALDGLVAAIDGLAAALRSSAAEPAVEAQPAQPPSPEGSAAAEEGPRWTDERLAILRDG